MKRRSMKVPADYNDADQSDSDPAQDPLFQTGENGAPSSPASPQLSGEVSDYYRRKRQREKQITGRDATYEAASRKLTDARNRIISPTPEEDDDEITGPIAQSPTKLPRKYNRRTPSVMWDHAINVNGKVTCKHCDKYWSNLGGSTSTPLKHIKDMHFAYITVEQRERMSRNSETSGTSGTATKRTIKKKKVPRRSLA